MSRSEEIFKGLGVSPEEMREPKIVETPEGGENNNDDNQDDVPDEDEELLLKKLQKKGINITSLSDIGKPAPAAPEHVELTPEQKEQKRKDKIAAARVYALDNSLISKETLDAYDRDLEKGDTIAFDLFKDEFLETIKGTDEEGTYSEDDIQAMWDQMNYSDDEDTSVKKKLRKQQISKIAKHHLTQKYGDVLSIETAFDRFQEEMEHAQQYKGIVEQAVSKLPTTFSFSVHGVNIDYVPTAEAVEQAKNVYLDPAAFKAYGKNATVDGLVGAIQTLVVSKEYEKVLAEVANSYYETRSKTEKMGRQGIIDRELNDGGSGNPGDSKTPGADRILNSSSKN